MVAGVGQVAVFVAQHLLVLERLHERFAGREKPLAPAGAAEEQRRSIDFPTAIGVSQVKMYPSDQPRSGASGFPIGRGELGEF
jgi:hypothetical protein